jgi:hypothetical protein
MLVKLKYILQDDKKSRKMLIRNRISSSCRIKNELLKFRSVNNIVIPAANTGNDNNNKNAVKNTAQTKRGIIFIRNPGVRIFNT